MPESRHRGFRDAWLVLAGLLEFDSNEVILHLGLQSASEIQVDGHAWLTVNGQKLETAVPPGVEGPHEEVLEIVISA